MVELAGPYYTYSGYRYYHNNDRWDYSQTKWRSLERSSKGSLPKGSQVQVQ